MTQVSANALKDSSGVLVTNATISFYPVNNAGVPISFKAGGGGQVMSVPVTAPVTNGAFTIQLADTQLSTPVNVGYSVSVIDNVTGKSLLGAGYSCVQPFGATWSFDNYVPNLASLVITQTGPTGQSAYEAAGGDAVWGSEANWMASLKGDPGNIASPVTNTVTFTVPPVAPNIVDNRNLAAGNEIAPQATEALALGSLVAGGDVAGIARIGASIYIGPDIYNPGLSFNAIPRTFKINFVAADAARQVEFYLLTPNGSGGYTPFWASGMLSFAGTGTYSYDVPNSANVRCPIGTVIGWMSTSGSSFAVSTATFSTAASSSINRTGFAQLVVGTTYTAGAGGFVADTTHIPQFSCLFIREGVLVPMRAADQPYGFAKLDGNAVIKPAQLVGTLPIVSDDYQTPPTITSALFGNPGASGGSTGGSFLITDYPTTFACVARSFTIVLGGAVSYELLLLSPNGDGTYKLLWSSGSQSGTTGTNTYVVPKPLAVRCPVGTIMGVVCQSNLVFLAVSGKTVFRMGTATIGAMQVGKSYGLNYDVGGTLNPATANKFGSTPNIPLVVGTFTHEAVTVATAWANKRGGYASLDDRGEVKVDTLPAYLGGTGPASVANGATETTATDANLGATKTSVTFPNNVNQYNVGPSLTMAGSAVGFNNRYMISYNETSPGFLSDGILTKLRIPPGGVTAAGAKMQAWVVRPIGTFAPGVTSATYSFNVIAAVGEITADTTGNYKEWSNLTIPVRAGDLIMLRGVLCSPGYITGGNPPIAPNNGYVIFPIAAEMTLNAPVGQVITSTSSNGLAVGHYAEVLTGGYAAGGTAALFGSDGHLLPNLYRQVDQPWNGKKVVAVGTSITAMNPTPGGGATNTGFINQMFRATQCNGLNFGVGSSTIVFATPGNPSRSSLSATVAELAAIGIGAGSYETSIVAQAPDLLIIDHGVNDDGVASGNMFNVDGSVNINRGTFLGANNYVIQKTYAANPNTRIILLTPPSIYAPGFVSPTTTTPQANLNAGIVQRVADLKALAAFWNFPLLDMSFLLGLTSVKTMPAVASNQLGTMDGLHPTQFTHDVMARLLIQFVNGI